MDGKLSYEEFPVFVPAADEHLGAVVCAPAGRGRDLGVVLLTGANFTRVHRNDMWVRLARTLAARGYPSIRFDYHGVGDSSGSLDRYDLETPFEDDVLAAARFLQRAAGVRHLALVGTCFGGRSALAAAARTGDAAGLVVFPLPVDGIAARGGIRSRLLRALHRRPGLAARLGPARMRRLGRPLVQQPKRFSSSFLRDLRSVLKHSDVHFVYGEGTSSLPEFRRLIEEVERGLDSDQRGRLHVEVLPGVELSKFRSLPEQEAVVRSALQRVELLHRKVVDREPVPLQEPE